MAELNSESLNGGVSESAATNYGWWKNNEEYSASDAIIDFSIRMQLSDLEVPIVPFHLRNRISINAEGLGISTEHCANPMDVYRMPYRNSVPHIANQTPYDFMVLAHAGHGLNSYAVGLAARLGNITIFQQSHWGGVYANPEHQKVELNAQIQVWNEMCEFLADIEMTSDEEYAVMFSPMRSIAVLLRREWRSPWETEPEARQLNNWQIALDLAKKADDAQKCIDWFEGRPSSSDSSKDFIEEIATEYLYRLVYSDVKMFDLVKAKSAAVDKSW